MRITPESYNNMNELTAFCFNANAIFDNLAYSLDYHYYNRIAHFVHYKVAHTMPEWADMITDKMLELSSRPVRKDIGGYEEDYTDLKEVFNKMHETFMQMREMCINMIDSAELNGDAEVRIFGEDFLQNYISIYIKQVEEWINACEVLTPNEFNIHIEDYTHFIK